MNLIISVKEEKMEAEKNKQGISFFEKYLSLWVGLCIIVGVAIGRFLPFVPELLSRFEYYNVS